MIGHVVKNRWVIDARFATPLSAGVDYRLSLSLIGTTVTVTVNGALLGSFSYNGAVVDGGLGTISRTGTTSFDDVHVVIGTHVSNLPDSEPPVLTVPANVTRAADPGKATRSSATRPSARRPRPTTSASPRSSARACRPETSSRSA